MRGRSAVNLRRRARNIAQAIKQGGRTAEEQAEALARALDRPQLAGVAAAAKITTAKEQQLAMGILEGVKDTLQARKARGGQRRQQQQEVSALDAGALGGLAGKRLGRQAARVLGIKRGRVGAGIKRGAAGLADPSAPLARPYRRDDRDFGMPVFQHFFASGHGKVRGGGLEQSCSPIISASPQYTATAVHAAAFHS
jgi:hypothetical protein